MLVCVLCVKGAERSLEEARCEVSSLEEQLHQRTHVSAQLGKDLRAVAQLFVDFKTCLNQILTQLANYEHRINIANTRTQTLKGEGVIGRHGCAVEPSPS